MKKLFSKKNEKGQGMVEYILVVGLIALVVFAAVNLFGNGLSNLFNSATSKVTGIQSQWN